MSFHRPAKHVTKEQRECTYLKIFAIKFPAPYPSLPSSAGSEVPAHSIFLLYFIYCYYYYFPFFILSIFLTSSLHAGRTWPLHRLGTQNKQQGKTKNCFSSFSPCAVVAMVTNRRLYPAKPIGCMGICIRIAVCVCVWDVCVCTTKITGGYRCACSTLKTDDRATIHPIWLPGLLS